VKRYNEQNVKRLSKRLEDYGALEIIYETDLKKPVLILIPRLNYDPFSYHKYLTSTEISASSGSTEEKLKLSEYYYHFLLNLHNLLKYPLTYQNSFGNSSHTIHKPSLFAF
jgi:hypothetical protein